MPRRRLSIWISLAFFGACSAEPPVPPEASVGPPASSELVFQAVDAGTGAALTDGQMTVRYLVRAPITLDASAVEQVSAREPYRIAHEVAEENLIVEVRLEASSYFRLDTVLSVPRGQSGGPFTIRMSRKLGQTAQGGGRRPAGGGAPAGRPAATQPAATTPAATAIDRSALDAGNRAFTAGDWLAATQAYRRMQQPNDATSAYANEYKQALVQRGIAHINRGELGGALEALDMAMEFDDPGYEAYLRQGQVQCAVGRSDEGRGTFAILSREVNQMPPAERPFINAMVQYHQGLCSEAEFDRSEAVMDRVSTGGAALTAYREFLAAAEEISPASPELQAAIEDATARIPAITQRIRG